MRNWISTMAAALACGCTAISPNKEPPPKPFAGTKWVLVMEIPLPGEQPWVRFGDGIMEGFGGCSKFVGRYVQDTVGARAIAFGRIEVDRRLCDQMPRLAETRMLEVLQSVSSYSITVDLMSMTGSAGKLGFRAADSSTPATQPAAASAPTPAGGPTLAGTKWRGVVEGVDEGATPWLEFLDGRFQGYTGCNMVSGQWRVESGELRVGQVVTTKRACVGAGGEVERRVLSAMNERGHVTRQGDRLVASGPGGERFELAEVR